jgi:hypothetical protein
VEFSRGNPPKARRQFQDKVTQVLYPTFEASSPARVLQSGNARNGLHDCESSGTEPRRARGGRIEWPQAGGPLASAKISSRRLPGHASRAFRLRSRSARRSHFSAVRLSGFVTALQRRTHPKALSYLAGALRFIAFPSLAQSCDFVRVLHRMVGLGREKRVFIPTHTTRNTNSNCT